MANTTTRNSQQVIGAGRMANLTVDITALDGAASEPWDPSAYCDISRPESVIVSSVPKGYVVSYDTDAGEFVVTDADTGGDTVADEAVGEIEVEVKGRS